MTKYERKWNKLRKEQNENESENENENLIIRISLSQVSFPREGGLFSVIL